MVELSFSLSELWAKNLKGGAEHPPPPLTGRIGLIHRSLDSAEKKTFSSEHDSEITSKLVFVKISESKKESVCFNGEYRVDHKKNGMNKLVLTVLFTAKEPL